MQNSDIFIEALKFRHACKLFDKNRKIKDEDIKYILESGRLSPSSFGMEGWKFLVITNQKLKEELRPYCWDQPQITTCSHLIVILAAIDSLKPNSEIVKKRFERRGLSEEKTKLYLNVYSNYMKQFDTDERVFAWSAKQTYIAAANMMMAAAMINIDSCPIEGFEREKVEEILCLDIKNFRLSLMLPFGYRVNPAPKKQRASFNEVVEFIL